MKTKECAYCDQDKKLTKEHIWPKCIINRLPEYDMRFSENANKVVGAELVIKDVCQDCNNNQLTNLDRYICELYDQYFFKFAEKNDRVNFNYDYEKLLRALLKISYNTARSSKTHSDILRKYRKYILNGGSNSESISILLQLIPPNDEIGKKIYPESTRSGRFTIGGPKEFEWVKIRVVAIRSYYFFLIFSDEKIENIPGDEFHIFYNNIPGIFIDPNKVEVEVNTNGISDAANIHLPHLTDKMKLYETFNNNR